MADAGRHGGPIAMTHALVEVGTPDPTPSRSPATTVVHRSPWVELAVVILAAALGFAAMALIANPSGSASDPPPGPGALGGGDERDGVTGSDSAPPRDQDADQGAPAGAELAAHVPIRVTIPADSPAPTVAPVPVVTVALPAPVVDAPATATLSTAGESRTATGGDGPGPPSARQPGRSSSAGTATGATGGTGGTGTGTAPGTPPDRTSTTPPAAPPPAAPPPAPPPAAPPPAAAAFTTPGLVRNDPPASPRGLVGGPSTAQPPGLLSDIPPATPRGLSGDDARADPPGLRRDAG